MMRYKVWTSQRGRVFDTLAEASAYASEYLRRTGIIVAVTPVRGRKKR